MREDILSQKIKRELLNLPIDTEPRVMYLLVEIRKVLEQENDKAGLLYFYGNWVVHPKLRKDWAKTVLTKMSDELNDNDGFMSQIINFRKIRQELKLFLEKNSLPIDITENEKYWEIFSGRLLDILVDVPIQEHVGDRVLNTFFFQQRSSGIEYAYRLGGKEGLGRVFVD